jgi:hypothetical protein
MAHAKRPEQQIATADNGEPSMNHTGLKKYGAILIILVVASACKGRGDADRNVDAPDLGKECLSGQCVKGQFETTYQRFAVITGNVVNLRARPDLTARVVFRPAVTRKVTVLYVKPGETTIGGMKGKWAFVRDCANINTSGWIFDHFLGYPDCFTRSGRWKIREVRVILGGKLTVYRCSADARFEIAQDEMLYKKDGKKKKTAVSGDILQCKNVVWFKKDRPDDYPIFFHILDNGTLALPDQYRNMRGIIMSK